MDVEDNNTREIEGEDKVPSDEEDEDISTQRCRIDMYLGDGGRPKVLGRRHLVLSISNTN